MEEQNTDECLDDVPAVEISAPEEAGEEAGAELYFLGRPRRRSVWD